MELFPARAGTDLIQPHNKRVGTEHVSVAVARDKEKASSLSGASDGPAGAFVRLDVSAQVVPL